MLPAPCCPRARTCRCTHRSQTDAACYEGHCSATGRQFQANLVRIHNARFFFFSQVIAASAPLKWSPFINGSKGGLVSSNSSHWLLKGKATKIVLAEFLSVCILQEALPPQPTATPLRSPLQRMFESSTAIPCIVRIQGTTEGEPQPTHY